MDHKLELETKLPETTLKKLAWYFQIPSQIHINDFFEKLPCADEGEVITRFSKYTRSLAGDDPDAGPDDAAEEKRLRISNHNNHHNEKNGKTSKKRKVTTITNPTAPFSIVEEGRRVAAKIDDEWMLMTVIKFSKRHKIYTLEDADDQAEKKEEHELHRDYVIPLASPEYTPPVFSLGSRVLAVYPGTTSFYPATVVRNTKRALSTTKLNGKALYDYALQFEDDDEDEYGETVVKKVKGELVIEEVNGL